MNLSIDEVDGAGNNGFMWEIVRDVRLYSCYWSPNTSNAKDEDLLRRLEASVRTSPVNVIVAGGLPRNCRNDQNEGFNLGSATGFGDRADPMEFFV